MWCCCWVVGLAAWGCTPAPAPLVNARRFDPVPLQVAPTEGTPDSRRVLVVVNIRSNEGIELAEYYARKRDVPPENILQVDLPTTEEIGDNAFQKSLLTPVKDAVAKSKNPIDFVVLLMGIPLRIDNADGYSVDSMLAGMYLSDELPIPPDRAPTPEDIERSQNPYFNSEESFSRERFNMLLVTRIDGFSLFDAKRMVERSIKAKPERGLFFFDEADNRRNDPESQESAGWHTERMNAAAAQLTSRGFLTKVERTKRFLAPPSPVMGYVSWGSNDDGFNKDEFRSVRFLSGAIAETYVSTSARTFISNSPGQSLIGDLIAAGVTGVKGYVSEPWTVALARVDILFDRYTRGATLAEAFYAASPMIRWKDVVIGDPICRPYAVTASAESQSATPRSAPE